MLVVMIVERLVHDLVADSAHEILDRVWIVPNFEDGFPLMYLDVVARNVGVGFDFHGANAAHEQALPMRFLDVMEHPHGAGGFDPAFKALQQAAILASTVTDVLPA